METLLAGLTEGVVTGVPVHYRFVSTEQPAEIRRRLVDAGVVVRAFSSREPHRLSGLRITAPADEEFATLASAIGEL